MSMERINLSYLYRMQFMAEMSADGMLNVIQFCMDLGLLSSFYECPKCGKRMNLTKREDISDKYEWVCRVHKEPRHCVKRTIRRGSWFSWSHMGLIDILLMTEFFVRNRSQEDIIYELNLSASTACDWRSLFREICMDDCARQSGPIGGIGEKVEIVESKFGKRKFNRGATEEEGWVIGGVERGSNKCFLKVVDKGGKSDLLAIIRDFVLPGTKIYSDCWKTHDCLGDNEFKQLSIEHSLQFEDSDSGVHTNVVKSVVKKQSGSRTIKDQFDLYIAEYLWRKMHSESEDLMRTFLEAVTRVYIPHTSDNILPEPKYE